MVAMSLGVRDCLAWWTKWLAIFDAELGANVSGDSTSLAARQKEWARA